MRFDQSNNGGAAVVGSSDDLFGPARSCTDELIGAVGSYGLDGRLYRVNFRFYRDARKLENGREAPVKLVIRYRGTAAHLLTPVRVTAAQWDEVRGLVIGNRRRTVYNTLLSRILYIGQSVVREVGVQGFRTAADIRRLIAIQLSPAAKSEAERIAAEEQARKSSFFAGVVRWMDDAYGNTKGITEKTKQGRRMYARKLLSFFVALGYVIPDTSSDEESLHLAERIGLTRNQRTSGEVDITQLDAPLLGNGRNVELVTYDEISDRFMQSYDRWLAMLGVLANSRRRYVESIYPIMRYALDQGLTTNRSFSKFELAEMEETKKRNYTVDELRRIFTADQYCQNERERMALDIWKVTFMLIGINTADLLDVTEIGRDGRLDYIRHKTGRPYSIYVHPEAREILQRLIDGQIIGAKSTRRYASSAGLIKVIKEQLVNVLSRIEQKPHEFDDITLYWARHSWATVASELDVPRDVIAAALGHGRRTVTDVYVDFNLKKVDEANRRIIDYVQLKK